MHILVRNQNFEKQKKWNSKIPKPKFLLSCEQNMLKKVVMEINGLNLNNKVFVFKGKVSRDFFTSVFSSNNPI
jgi:hypothetical protein